jgi:hypothetical protein
MPRRFSDLKVSAHLAEFLAGPEEFVALGELADDLIRRVPPALVRCHVIVDSSLPETGQQSRTTTGHYDGAHLIGLVVTRFDNIGEALQQAVTLLKEGGQYQEIVGNWAALPSRYADCI